MLLYPRSIRILLRVLLGLLLSLALLALGLVLLVQSNPRNLTDRALAMIAARSGLRVSAEAVSVVILPLPSLALSNAALQGAGWRFHTAYATVRPDFLALLRGDFVPRHVRLLRPRLEGSVPLPLAALLPGGDATPAATPDGQKETAAPAAKPSDDQGAVAPPSVAAPAPPPAAGLPASPPPAAAARALPDLAALGLTGRCRLSVTDGAALVAGTDKAVLRLEKLDCDLDLTPPARLKGRLSLALARLEPKNAPPWQLGDLQAEGRTDLSAPLERSPRLTVGGELRSPGLVARRRREGTLTAAAAGWTLRPVLSGELRKDGVALPFRLTGAASLRNSAARSVRLDNVRLHLDRDDVALDGRLTLDAAAPGGFSLEGRLRLIRASLTQWLGFGRIIAPGLQWALDDLTEGTLDFSLDGAGLRVPHIAVSAAGSRFTGSGGVARWSKPELDLDLRAPRVNLGRALPESLGTLPAEPQFGHGPFTPLPGAPVLPGEAGLDYNIRLAADKVDYGPLVIDNALVVIRQGLVDATTRLEDTVLEVSGGLYGGSVKGETVLGGDKSLPYAIRMRFRNVDGTALGRALPVMPVSGGSLRADVDILSQGRELDVFLRSLRGTVNARAERGRLRRRHGGPKAGAGDAAFGALDVGLKLKGGAWDQSRLGLDGQWTAALTDTGLEARTELNGTLWFGGDGSGGGDMEIKNVPGACSLPLSPERAGRPEGLKASVSGTFACRAARGQLSVREGHINALGAEAHGDVQVTLGASPSWQGKLSAYSPDLGRTLRLAGYPAAVPAAWNKLEMDAAFKGEPGSLDLSGIRARLDQSVLTGKLSLDWRQALTLDYSLAVDRLDLDRYLNGGKGAAGTGGKSAAQKDKSGGKAWDLRWLRALNAKGELRVGELVSWKLRTRQLRLTSSLAKGRLRYEAKAADFYGAPLHNQGTMVFDKGLSFENALGVENFDLTAASRDRGGAAVLGGRGVLHSTVRGQMEGPGQLPARLDGSWDFTVRDGSYQRRSGDGALKGSPTRFAAAGGSGIIAKGVARTSDFYLKGQGLSVRGGGWIDFNNETLDCNFTVNMKNFPDFPLRLYGSLENSKTSIGAGTLLLNTIGGITQGFIDVLGSVVEGTWRLFR
jgi:AsmA protein